MDFRILHATGSGDWPSLVKKLAEHFSEGGCPVMMGGKNDAASKCVIGVHGHKHLLILVNSFRVDNFAVASSFQCHIKVVLFLGSTFDWQSI